MARGLSTDPDPDDIEEMSLLSLQRALRAQTIKTEKLERDLKTARRMSTGRASLDSDGGERARSTIARPKLKEPPPFPTEYKETYNAHNWLHQLYRYLNQCRVDEDEFSGYARTYMGALEQAWMDAEFGEEDTPPWDTFYNAVVRRFVPPDHDDSMHKRFDRMRQRDTLLHYMEEWQVLSAALTFSKIRIAEPRKVAKFIEGMRDQEDRYKVIYHHPETLSEVFEVVHKIRRSKILALEHASERTQRARLRETRRGRTKSPSRRFNKLEGAAKKKAWDEGACLNCGAKDHFIAKCPTLKSSIKSAVKKYAKFYNKKDKKTASTTATAGSKKRLHNLQTNTKDDDEEEEETTGTSETDLSHTDSDYESKEDGEEEENSHPESEG